ncbi:MAG: zinc ABC transporter substrate-binding protein [Deltaproteobacteria bacterium]|nr:zinc ABC transporter substrate-binding protein [Deltaproteobacteria bacterium]MBW1792879.1 zinc ABC transporter substrate-binding protein [Deltaproteobacteria bacterium]
MKKRSRFLVGFFLALFSGSGLLRAAHVYSEPPTDPGAKIKAFVSILPQAYFVERVGGERVDVSVMVGPGHSPATYEPVPKQMAMLSEARVYFRIGVPFENVWMGRISKTNPNMKVVDTRRGIELLPMKGHHRHKHEGQHHHGKGLKDPHIWLSLRLVKIQAENICDALIVQDAAHRIYYQNNLRTFRDDLDKLDAEITRILKNSKTRQFMVFHPSWGYFARDYALEQLPIEIEGKEASGKVLARLIQGAREEGIKVVFVQQQFSKKSAETVARTIGGKVIQIDPLARDWLNNMRNIAETFAKVMQ